jgi:hypothetical protein
MNRNLVIVALATLTAAALGWEACAGEAHMRVGTFPQEMSAFHNESNGLPGEDVRDIAITADGTVWAATANGLAYLKDNSWSPVERFSGDVVPVVAADGESVALVFRGALHFLAVDTPMASLPPAASAPGDVHCLAFANGVYVGTKEGLYVLRVNRLEPVEGLNALLAGDQSVRDIAAGPNGQLAVAAASGLYYNTDGKTWQALSPEDGKRRWAPEDVRSVVFDSEGRLWFASPQGAGCLSGGWTLYTGREGLPYNDFTCMAAGADGTVYFGTHIGAVRYNGEHWAYRQGLRWVPDDDIRAIAVGSDRSAWLATADGVGRIYFKPMTLAEKAKFYEEEIDKYHRRTEYGYVLSVTTAEPGKKVGIRQSDSDNDGLWTSMYGAGECFAYAVTGDPKAKERAQKAFEALRFLSVVTQGGSKPSLPGFVARTVVPVGEEEDPNVERYTAEKDRERQKNDRKWKVIHPRWPKSADGEWYYKVDTSSDELDGHYFFNALYYDLVAETEEEKQRVRDVVAGMTDHFLENGFNLVDWDGKVTRWAVFGPEHLNHDIDWWEERGLNSLSILSYLATAEHMTGDPKYREAINLLVKDYAYAANTTNPKMSQGWGDGNQSDDEMAFMGYYNLLNYEKNPRLRNFYLLGFARYWQLEEPEMNPLFNFIYASRATGEKFVDTFGVGDLTPRGEWLADSVETLMRFPLDRFNWRHINSHRIDIQPLLPYLRGGNVKGHGYRMNNKVIPVDEKHFNHWNYDAWALDTGGNGTTLSDGATFLLPYYMGLYHGYIVESE